MNQIYHIIKYKSIAFLRFDSKLTSFAFLKAIGSGLIYTAFAIGAFFFSKSLIYFLLVEVTIGKFLLHEFISMILFIFFMSINAGNILVSYSTLYKSSEVQYFLTKPVEPAKIFTIKFLDNFFYSSSTLLMVLFSLLLGYSVYFKIRFIEFLVLVINFIPFMVSAGSLGVIFLITVILLANRFGVKKVLITFGIFYVTTIILFFRTNSPKQLINSVLNFYPIIDKDVYLSDLVPTILKYLPNNWLAQSAYWTLLGDERQVAFYSLLQIGLALFLFFSAYQLGKKYYFKTWLLNHKFSSELKSKKEEILPFLNSKENESKISSSIYRKDYLVFVREPSQIIHSIVLLFLLTIFIISAAGIKYAGLGNYYLQTMIYLALFIFILLLIATLSLRFIFPLISLEGQSFWKIKTAPVSLKKYLFYKLKYPAAIILLISSVLSLFTNYKFGIILISFSLFITILASLTIISINFGMGSIFVNYKEKNPIRISSSQGASLSFLCTILYILFLVILLFKPFSELFLSIMISKGFNLLQVFYYLIPIMLLSAVIVYLFYKASVNNLKRDF